MSEPKYPKLYARRDTEAICTLYGRHVMAMTSEGLHEKSAIAGELAYRDSEIADLRQRLIQVEGERDAALAKVEESPNLKLVQTSAQMDFATGIRSEYGHHGRIYEFVDRTGKIHGQYQVGNPVAHPPEGTIGAVRKNGNWFWVIDAPPSPAEQEKK